MGDKKEVPIIYDDMSEEPGESKTPFGDIHRSDYIQEAQMVYDESTDDSSSLGSSPYQSDEEIIKSLFAHGNESTSSSDDQETLHADFPSMAIDIEESRLILDQTALKRATDPGHRIFPQSAKKHLEHPVNRLKVITEEISDQQVETNLILNQTDLKRATDPGHTIFPHSAKANLELSLQNTSDEVDVLLQNPGDDVGVISREIQNVLYQHDGWAYIAHQMAHIGKFECRKLPNMSICDVAIIRATQPLHILTFVEDGGKQEHAVEYNAQLTRSIMGFIKEKTGVSLDVVYGVVPASTWKDEKLFKEKLERLETVARRKALPGYLHMDTERYTAITKALVDLYSEPGEKPQEDPPNPEARRDTSRDQFINACRFGDLQTVRAAMDWLDVNGAGSNGVTPLRASIENSHFTVMKFLVKKGGANPTLVDGEGRNILHLASMRGDRQKVEFILSLKKMDINAKDNEGMTAADLARHWKHKKVVEILSSDKSITGCYSLSQCPQPPDSRSLPTQESSPRQTGSPTFHDQQWDAGVTFYPGPPQGCKYVSWRPKRTEQRRRTSQLHTMQEVKRLCKKLLKHRYDKKGKLIRAKILIFGPGRAGKSSFCNGLRSALKDPDELSNYFSVRNFDSSFTSTLQSSQYGNHWIIDMPGIFESSDFRTENIEAIASGKITKIMDVKGGLSQQEEWKDVSCAVLVLHHGITVDEELKRQIDAVIRLGGDGAPSYHLVLTYLDEYDREFKDTDNIPNLYSSPRVQEAVKMMSEQTGIQPCSISYVRNYAGETQTHTNTKLLHLEALDRIITSAADQEGTMISDVSRTCMETEQSAGPYKSLSPLP
ncbi:uncharacterized protein [Haliotis cracherodii]|uniref:uncharacterized protein isoform X2 n=1 Tax=Haliotis cracherodii TaxID=6455 RepID=UPI0039EA070D